MVFVWEKLPKINVIGSFHYEAYTVTISIAGTRHALYIVWITSSCD
jgi:hypothetical protein